MITTTQAIELKKLCRSYIRHLEVCGVAGKPGPRSEMRKEAEGRDSHKLTALRQGAGPSVAALLTSWNLYAIDV